MSPLLFYKGIVGKFTIKNLCGDKIISKYPYREEVYKKSGNAFKSVPFDKIPKGYYSKVQKEDE